MNYITNIGMNQNICQWKVSSLKWAGRNLPILLKNIFVIVYMHWEKNTPHFIFPDILGHYL